MTIHLLKLKSSNWRSVEQAIKLTNFNVTPLDLYNFNKINPDSIVIIPGVGNIKSLSKEIEFHIGIEHMKRIIIDNNIKVIGICLGFQFLCKSSEEDLSVKCLKLFDYDVRSIFTPSKPSVGWNQVIQNHHNKIGNEPIDGLIKNYFYFTHSYGINTNNFFPVHQDIYSYELNNRESILAAIVDKNYIGFQFHPEKSGSLGIKLLSSAIGRLFKSI